MQNQHTSYEPYLDDFFSEVSPTELKKTILHVYFNYLIYMDMQNIPKDFSMIAEDILSLVEFLDTMAVVRNSMGFDKTIVGEGE